MKLVKSIISGGLVKYIKRYSTIFMVDATTSVGLFYLWNKGYKYLVPTVSLCCIGGTYLYSRTKSREKISANQAIVMIGCDSGLGYSLALHCRQLGANVIASVLQIDGPAAKKLEQEGVHVYPLDITQVKSVENFTGSVRTVLTQKCLALRCLVNNAAKMIFGEFEWQTDEQLRNQVEVNLLGNMRITRELMPMIRAHSSRIIVISSHCSIQPMELKKYGVKVVSFIPGSFVKESNILARQAEHFEAMRRSMSEEARTFYGDYFDTYSQYFASVTQGTKLQKLQDSRVYEVFEGALLDKYPSAVYKNDPWRYFVYHALFGITPTCVRDLLVLKFVQGPPWTKRNINESTKNLHKLQGNISGSSDRKGQTGISDAFENEKKTTDKS
ncbi:Short-chain dehydrogenase/reductase family 9C member 7 [Habropoda laboriosa]|uniref:Short-chain dehydrogenase/reductase family 9C member 7 n=1 Tax=Habropoda laboriosa TaxID=597456 RepID=A0A0L7QM99_9HYME|nr:Short-chain dehydrogenase/reductase family 9C member 7 [Habropoda laboriosa]